MIKKGGNKRLYEIIFGHLLFRKVIELTHGGLILLKIDKILLVRELDLYFERFINPYRVNPPDFDIDFSWKNRDDITRYLF